MNTKHLAYLSAIAESGSLSAAARKLKISQPVLSRYLAKTEQELGTPLFYRLNHRYALTQAGAICLEGARKILDIQSETLHTFSQMSGSERQYLSIGMTPHHGGTAIAYMYPRLIRRYPSLDLNLKESYSYGQLQALHNGEVSLCLNYYQPELMPMVQAPIFGISSLLFALPVHHPMAKYGSTDFSRPARMSRDQFLTITDIPFVLYGPNTFSGQLIDQFFQKEGFSPITTFRSDNTATISGMLSSGLYAGFILNMTARKIPDMVYFTSFLPYYLAAGLFSAVHQPTEIERYAAFLHYQFLKQDAVYTPRTNRFMEVLVRELS